MITTVRVFWEIKDTLYLNDMLIKRNRQGGCDNISPDSSIFCIENQTHTINKKTNRVERFEGLGSGYFATIDFKYDEFGRLVEYIDFDELYVLNYNKSGALENIFYYQVLDGKKEFNERITFKNLEKKND